MTPRYVWGIDPDAHGCAIVVLADSQVEDVVRVKVKTGNGDELAGRMGRVRRAVAAEAQRLAYLWPPSRIVIEQPAGQHPAPSLMAAWGCILAALADVDALRCPVVPLTPPKWRGRIAWRLVGMDTATARGFIDGLAAVQGRPVAATHPIRKRDKQRSLLVARRLGYDGFDVDVADAACLALAAERTDR